MEYKFIYDFEPSDLFKITMRRIYHSYSCIINIVFTAAALALLLRFWNESGSAVRFCLVMLVIVFPVIQPLAIYGNCAKQLENVPKNMALIFKEDGLHIESGEKKDYVPWAKIANATKDKDKITVICKDGFGYILLNRALGDLKEEFFSFLCNRVKKH